MKQHISPSQAKEITEEQFYLLFNQIVKRKDWADYHHEKVTIGKMIEILSFYDLDIMSNYYKQNEWSIIFYKEEHYIFRNVELCDALWEGIKSIL